MFLAFGCCIRLANSFSANCTLTPVLTEVAGPHRPRSVASSTLCITFLAIVLISHSNNRVLTALLSLPSPIRETMNLNVLRVGFELPSLTSLCTWMVQSQQSVHGDEDNSCKRLAEMCSGNVQQHQHIVVSINLGPRTCHHHAQLQAECLVWKSCGKRCCPIFHIIC